MSKIYKHIFFDLDHTLWDFEYNSRHTLAQLYHKHKLAETLQADHKAFYNTYSEINYKKWELYRMGSISKEELRIQRFHDTFCHMGYDDIDFCRLFEQEYLEICPRQTALLPGARELLDYLRKYYELHIITNGFAQTQDIKLSKSGIAHYFGRVFSSENMGVNKPGAAIFMDSLKQVGACCEESLMVGDNLQADVIGARNCGIDQVYFNPARLPHDEEPTFEVSHLLEMKAFL